MRIVIAGSNGFVGKKLKQLISTSKEHMVVSEIDITNGLDLCDYSIIDKVPEFDCFIHLANLVYVPDSYSNPEKFYRINYLSTLNALELCRKYKAHLVYISSYIYGQPAYLPVDEKHPINPFNPYAQTKVICEKLCEGYFRDFGVDITILRPFNIYGKGQKGKLLIPEIESQIAFGQKEVHLRDSSPRRDYVNVKDVAKAVICATKDKKGLNIYNVCSGTSISVKEISEIINKQLSEPVSFVFSDSDRPNEVDETRGCFDKIHLALGWTPEISFEEGIKEIFDKKL